MTLLPCSNCGAELHGAEDTTTVTETGRFEFQGQSSELEVPAKVCPECGEVTAL